MSYIIPPAPSLPIDYKLAPSIPSGRRHYEPWHLGEVRKSILEWVEKAKEEKVDIQKELKKITATVEDAASICSEGVEKMSELQLNQQVIVRRLFCSQIIRKIVKEKILRLKEAGLSDPNLASQRDLITGSVDWALRQLPPRIFLLSPHIMAERCNALWREVTEDKVPKIIEKARKERLSHAAFVRGSPRTSRPGRQSRHFHPY